MNDTRLAAARFVSDVVSPIDQAFLVDFDDRPRLAHGRTDNVLELISALGRLQPGGATALYDAVMFSIVQFDLGLGRKAIVLLTDGDDYRSQFSYSRLYEAANQRGVPIYFLALAGFDQERPSIRKSDLEAIAKASGGRVFYPNGMEEVGAAYQQIADELRSQYVLAFTTDRELTDEEIGSLEVEVKHRGAKLRFAVGRQ